MVRKVVVCAAVLATLGLSVRSAQAGPIELVINAPEFLIPLNGQSGVLDVYANGSATTTGFNALGSQTFFLGAGATSTGDLLLNFHFSGFPLGDPSYEITNAVLGLSVYDLDLKVDWVTSSIKLWETAYITSAGGETAAINLKNYLPTGSTTDDRLIQLNPVPLFPPLEAGFFDDPFTISIALTATVRNYGSSGVTLLNTPEQIVPTVKLRVEAVPVPEPGSMFLLATGLAVLAGSARRLRRC
jgi:hypothetical protein